MKDSYSKGLTNHTGPESCEVFSNELLEALTGVRAGWVLSREILVQGADAVGGCGRQHRSERCGEVWLDPARSETPCMYGNNLCENREILCSSLRCVGKERVENSKEVRLQ
jgi:RNA-directed DNA polymerase